MHACMCMYILCMYMYMHMYMYNMYMYYMYMSMSMCMCMCMCMSACMYMYMYMLLYMSKYWFMSMFVYMYTYKRTAETVSALRFLQLLQLKECLKTASADALLFGQGVFGQLWSLERVCPCLARVNLMAGHLPPAGSCARQRTDG